MYKIITFSTLLLFAMLIFSCGNADKKKIENVIRAQLAAYPQMRLQDIYKNFYQDSFGTGHAIADTAMVSNWLRSELQNSTFSATPLVEPLGWRNRFVRISIDAVRQGKIDTATLADVFVRSASLIVPTDTANWETEWATVIQIIETQKLPVAHYQTDKIWLDSLLRENPKRAMHHSRDFNAAYNPHYRVVKSELAAAFFLQE